MLHSKLKAVRENTLINCTGPNGQVIACCIVQQADCQGTANEDVINKAELGTRCISAVDREMPPSQFASTTIHVEARTTCRRH